jgi:hypothetical protein
MAHDKVIFTIALVAVMASNNSKGFNMYGETLLCAQAHDKVEDFGSE